MNRSKKYKITLNYVKKYIYFFKKIVFTFKKNRLTKYKVT